jgi:transposase-like protein
MENYPKTLAELENRFSTDNACREYLFSLRWQDGFLCPKCGGQRMTLLNNGLYLCLSCDKKVSVTQGTIFQDSHLPLITWFRAMWYICVQKNGASALGLQRALGLGSYRTAWLCLHKLRRAMVRSGREKLSGEVEVDETYVGGAHSGKRGRGAVGKSIVFIAAERDGRGIGRIRLKCISDVTSLTLKSTIQELISGNSKIITDAWPSYTGTEQLGYAHEVTHSDDAMLGEDMLPRCHRIASLLKRWIIGTLQGSLSAKHMQDYLDEFTFRFNRRKSASRGKLFYRLVQQTVITDANPYSEIVKHKMLG